MKLFIKMMPLNTQNISEIAMGKVDSANEKLYSFTKLFKKYYNLIRKLFRLVKTKLIK